MQDFDPLIGRLVDRKYEITELLGKGAMGSVYKAQHKLMNRTVAIKLVNPEHMSSGKGKESFLQRFELEARAASRITHPNAITMYDYGLHAFDSEEELPFLVLEFLSGKTLKQVMGEESLTKERLACIFEQICGALDEAHSLGIVHRDLKPDNIMITKRPDGSDWAQVLDFGIAKIFASEDENDSALTNTGIIVGTPRYMSPEQAKNDTLDARSDVYALGVLLYEALTGDTPFHSGSVMEVVIQQINDEPPPIKFKDKALRLPDGVKEVVLKALEKNPDDRYESASALSSELTNVLLHGGVSRSRKKKRGKRSQSTSSGLPWMGAGVVMASALVLSIGYANTEALSFLFEPKRQSEAPVENQNAALDERLRKIEQYAEEAQRRAKKAEEKAATLNQKALELELQVGLQQEQTKKLEEAGKKTALVKKSKAENQAELKKRREAEARRRAKAARLKAAQEKAEARKREKIQAELREAKRQAALAEAKAKQAEEKAKELEAIRKLQSQQLVGNEKAAPAKEAPKKKRRRCGPTWC